MNKNPEKRKAYIDGLRDGLPIGLGYFAVSFSLGIMAKTAGITPVEGFITSVLSLASAGEYAGFSMIIYHSTFLETLLVAIITNARYLLMSAALSQRFSPETPLLKRISVSYFITDEIFGANIGRPGYVVPEYTYGIATVAPFLWGLGTSLGIIAGNILPVRVVSALSVALYGMFIAIFVPPAKKNKAVRIAVLASFFFSYILSEGSFIGSRVPMIGNISSGTKIILLTVIISAVAAMLKPISDEEDNDAAKPDEAAQGGGS